MLFFSFKTGRAVFNRETKRNIKISETFGYIKNHGTHVNLFTGNSSKSVDFTAQKMKFSIKDFFSKCNQIRSFLVSFFVQCLKILHCPYEQNVLTIKIISLWKLWVCLFHNLYKVLLNTRLNFSMCYHWKLSNWKWICILANQLVTNINKILRRSSFY